jgi:hypothetical protein
MASTAHRKSVEAIEKLGACLVFPLDNRPEPRSLWATLHPRSRMRWEWDSEGDDRVAKLWRLREELSKSGEVVYTKWYRGRATFFSRSAFRDLLAYLGTPRAPRPSYGPARDILEALEDRSPLSTKELKRATDLVGRDREKEYSRALKGLWEKGWVVGWGEIDDGAFPSLALAAAPLLFEDIWSEASKTSAEAARERLFALWPEDNLFRKQAEKIHALSPPTLP